MNMVELWDKIMWDIHEIQDPKTHRAIVALATRVRALEEARAGKPSEPPPPPILGGKKKK